MPPSSTSPEPSVAEAGLLPRAKPPSAIRRFGVDILEFIYLIYGALVLLSIGFSVGVLIVMVVTIVFVLSCGLPLGFIAAHGAIVMLIGNGILRAAQLAHYTDNGSAAAIGATGAIITSIIGGIFIHCVPKNENGRPPWFISMIAHTLVSTLTGTIGCAILVQCHIDLGPIDVQHAARAGALGGAILGPGMILIVPFLFGMLVLILSPVWLAMMEILRWVAARWTESLDGLSQSHSYL